MGKKIKDMTREELRAYYREWHRESRRGPQVKRSAHIRWVMVSVRSGGYMGVQYLRGGRGPKFACPREAERTSLNPHDIMTTYDDKAVKMINKIIAGERLFTM